MTAVVIERGCGFRSCGKLRAAHATLGHTFVDALGDWVEAGPRDATHLLHDARGTVVAREDATSTRDRGHGQRFTEDLVDRGHPGWRRVKWRKAGKR